MAGYDVKLDQSEMVALSKNLSTKSLVQSSVSCGIFQDYGTESAGSAVENDQTENPNP